MVFCATVLAAGCREAVSALGRGERPPSQARAQELFTALQGRVTLPFREPRFDSARTRIGRAAFLPSRVWKDTSVWTRLDSVRHVLSVAGRLSDGRYGLHAVTEAPLPQRLADSRHVIALTSIRDGEYAWDTDVQYAIGSASAADVAAFVAALLSGAEGLRESDIRDRVRSTAPRSTGVLGQLFRVDSIRTAHLADTSTLATFNATLTPTGIEERYPHFAGYMRKYGETTRMQWTLEDSTGAVFVECSLRNGRMLLRLRTSRGKLLALGGPARPMPDTLQLHGDFVMKVRRFTVGFQRYQAEFIVQRSARERAWGIVSQREPDWILPLFTERLLRTPLRRPFQGRGASFRIGVRDSAGAQTLLARTLHVEVQESAILRFLGRLGAIAIADYTGDAEREQYAWLKEFFDGLIADVLAQR